MKDGVVNGSTAPIKYTEEDDEFFLTKDGVGISYADLKSGDAIKYYTVDLEDGVKYIGEVISDVVEGKVSAKGDGYVKVDGKKYDLAGIKSPAVEAEIKAYLNNAGKIVMWEKVEGTASEVAMIKYARLLDGKYVNSADWEVELFFADGSKSEKLVVDAKATFDAFAEDVNVSEYVVTADEGETLPVDGAQAALQTKGKELFVYNNKYYTTAEKVREAMEADEVVFYDEDKLLDTTANYYFAGEAKSKEEAGMDIIAHIVSGVDEGKAITCYEINGSDVTFKPSAKDENQEFFDIPSYAQLVVTNSVAYITELVLVDDENETYTGRAYVMIKQISLKSKKMMNTE